ncbi:MAG: hypothetical protein HWE12_07995 [Oceanospirillaceae bacterium]|nr:hypothetical protein [Oceanospirillaceae bacterium]
MQSSIDIDTPNLGPVTVSQHVVKHFSKLCNSDMDEALAKTEKILKDPEIERLEIPAAVAEMMADPNVLEFWLHRDRSTVFMVKPQKNARLVEMVMNQSMAGFQFDNTRS